MLENVRKTRKNIKFRFFTVIAMSSECIDELVETHHMTLIFEIGFSIFVNKLSQKIFVKEFS